VVRGIKTRAVFNRYNLAFERDLSDAAKKSNPPRHAMVWLKCQKVPVIDEKGKAVQNETIQ
jgi:hypothetical protein